MENTTKDVNLLFPVFFRLDKLKLLVVGGGAVGLEKTEAIIRSSGNVRIKLVAPEIREEIRALAIQNSNLELIVKPYDNTDLNEIDLVIAATCIKALNHQVMIDAKKNRILCNVADTPDACDFYLSSIVTKGNLKIAISTNGKSPTFAKRMRELLDSVLPNGIDEILNNLTQIREKLKGDFDYKVKKLNEITSVMKEDKNELD